MKTASLARWSLCFVAALGIHAGGAAAIYAHLNLDEGDPGVNAALVMIDMAPVAAAPKVDASDNSPDRVDAKSQAGIKEALDKPDETLDKALLEPEPGKPEDNVVAAAERPADRPEAKPDPMPQAELAMLPPPKPVEEKADPKPDARKTTAKRKRTPRQRHDNQRMAAADQKSNRPASPMPGTSNSDALPTWRARVAAQLERNKRSPGDGAIGIAMVSFYVDGAGVVHNARISRSSGSSPIDEAALAMMGRASPLPPPPPEILVGGRIFVTVPFTVH